MYMDKRFYKIFYDVGLKNSLPAQILAIYVTDLSVEILY